jgi:hypothetical protein
MDVFVATDVWELEYGTDQRDLGADVVSYITNAVQQSAAGESGAILRVDVASAGAL